MISTPSNLTSPAPGSTSRISDSDDTDLPDPDPDNRAILGLKLDPQPFDLCNLSLIQHATLFVDPKVNLRLIRD